MENIRDLNKEEKTDVNKIIYNIKSDYVLKKIFSLINIKQKLNLIIYNKQLQKKLGVDIEDYKKTSGKYKIAEKNGKGKEYRLNTNIMIFEGEYLNGKRNGKGKECDFFAEFEFEGEYLNGKKWNGKGYNKVCKVDYEIKEGKGKVKEYNILGKLKYEGVYLNGDRNGKEKE